MQRLVFDGRFEGTARHGWGFLPNDAG